MSEEERLRNLARRLGGLCPECANLKIVESSKGSVFLMCRLAKDDPRFPKYPPQPVRSCQGFQSIR